MMFQCCSSAAEEARKEIYEETGDGFVWKEETGDGSLSPLLLSSAGKSVIIEDG